jgi:hypothetical protein
MLEFLIGFISYTVVSTAMTPVAPVDVVDADTQHMCISAANYATVFSELKSKDVPLDLAVNYVVNNYALLEQGRMVDVMSEHAPRIGNYVYETNATPQQVYELCTWQFKL